VILGTKVSKTVTRGQTGQDRFHQKPGNWEKQPKLVNFLFLKLLNSKPVSTGLLAGLASLPSGFASKPAGFLGR
jgi:hypothetical protein